MKIGGLSDRREESRDVIERERSLFKVTLVVMMTRGGDGMKMRQPF